MDSNILIAGIAAVALVAVVVLIVWGERRRAAADRRIEELVRSAETMTQSQVEFRGRLEQTQVDLNARLESLTQRFGEGLTQQTEKTGETLNKLHERLAVIDAAQKNLTDLSQQVVGLQDILANKQARGAFGEIQLNDLVTNLLPPSAYAFQAPVGSGRADCLLKLPNPPGPIVIDAKFPLESYRAFREAGDEASAAAALKKFGADVTHHVQAIAQKYIVPGETAESALMFLPSEAVYAELHASLPDIVERSYKARVWIVSPTTLMALLNTVRAVLKDVSMREQAGKIQTEVLKMMEDVGRLGGRVDSLEKHFEQASKDIGQIRTSADKVIGRGEKIGEIELGEDLPAEDLPPPRPRLVEGE
jgi:DNA recombination protein RmuC